MSEKSDNWDGEYTGGVSKTNRNRPPDPAKMTLKIEKKCTWNI